MLLVARADRARRESLPQTSGEAVSAEAYDDAVEFALEKGLDPEEHVRSLPQPPIDELQELLERAYAVLTCQSTASLIQEHGRRRHTNLFALNDLEAARALGWFDEGGE